VPLLEVDREIGRDEAEPEVETEFEDCPFCGESATGDE
jgi:hypothetical protein